MCDIYVRMCVTLRVWWMCYFIW